MTQHEPNNLQHLFGDLYISKAATAALNAAGQSWAGFLALHIASGRESSRWTITTGEVLELTSQVGITVINLVGEGKEGV